VEKKSNHAWLLMTKSKRLSIKNLLELISEFTKLAWYKNDIQKSTAFPCMLTLEYGNLSIFSNMDDTRGHYVNSDKPGSERQILYIKPHLCKLNELSS
jgi:hypothetical protein